MADLPLLADRLYNRPHLVSPGYLETIASVLAARMSASALPVAEPVRRTAREAMISDGILVMPIIGGLYHRGDALDAVSGSNSFTNLTNELKSAMSNPDVRAILLDIDCPGSEAVGCFEFCEALVAFGQIKPIRAIANGTATSGGYAIAAATEHVYAIPSASVGSIGVVTMHLDRTKMAKKAGVAVTFVYAGKHKVDGNPFEKLPDSVRASMQSGIDGLYSKFVSYVAERRPTMTEPAVRRTEASIYDAEEAEQVGLVDEVATFDAAMSAFAADLRSSKQKPRTGASPSMSTSQNSAPADGGASMSEAISRAFADGQASARATAQADNAAAYARGRADAAAIVVHANAEGRAAFAAELAADAAFSVDKATTMLARVPKADEGNGASFVAKLKEEAPKVAAGADKGSGMNDAPDAFASTINANLSRIYSGGAR